LPLFATLIRFREHTEAADDAAAAAPPLRPLHIPGALATGTIWYLQKSFSHRQGRINGGATGASALGPPLQGGPV